MWCNDALQVHSLYHCSIATILGNSIELPSLINNTLFSIVIALSEMDEHFSYPCQSFALQTAFFFLTEHKWQGPNVFPAARHHTFVSHTFRPLQYTAPSVKVCRGYAHIHFLLIMSFWCLWLLPECALGLLISEYIINNLHVISFVLIIFVWQNVSLHGECWGYLPHLETQGTPCRVHYVALFD